MLFRPVSRSGDWAVAGRRVLVIEFVGRVSQLRQGRGQLTGLVFNHRCTTSELVMKDRTAGLDWGAGMGGRGGGYRTIYSKFCTSR